MLLTASQIAEVLGVPLRTVQWRTEKGHYPVVQKLPGVRGAYLYDLDAVRVAHEQYGTAA